MQRIKPVTGGVYHVYNRGVDKRNIFLNDADYLRFIHDLFEFNDKAPAFNINYHVTKNPIEVGLRYMPKRETRELLVELYSFCLMPNHIHLMLRQKTDSGVTEFMRKLGTGYTNYFNQKYKRAGALFQGKYKCVRLTREEHLLHLPYYIHCNSLDLTMPAWRERKIKNYRAAMKFLEQYRWSSFPDYIGKKNFPSVTQRKFLIDFLGGPERYRKDTLKWLGDIDLKTIAAIAQE